MSRIILNIALIAAAALPSIAQAQQVAQTVASAAGSDQTYLDFQVEQVVKVKSLVAPEYPPQLRSAGVVGQVLVQFVVDERGKAQMNTFKVLKSRANAFSESVKWSISQTTFYPAELQGRKVKQLVQQPFTFAATNR